MMHKEVMLGETNNVTFPSSSATYSRYRAESLPCYISLLFLPLPSDIAVAKWIHQHYHVSLNVAQL